MPIAGGCRCGAVRYTLAIDALPSVYACHCLFCQTWSGSAFALHALLPAAAVELSGPLTVYDHPSIGGHISRQHLCSVCHTRVGNDSVLMPGMFVLRAGTLDDSHLLEPVAHIWTRRKQPWIQLAEGVPSWPESPTPEEYAAAMRKGRVPPA